jgi:hypothetical protein
MGRLTALGGAAFVGGGAAITGWVSCLLASSRPAALSDAVRGGSFGAAASTGGVAEGGIRARVGMGSAGVAAGVSGLGGGEAAGCAAGSAAAGGPGGGTADAGSSLGAGGAGADTDLAEAAGAGAG